MMKMKAKQLIFASMAVAPMLFSACGDEDMVENPDHGVDIVGQDSVHWTRPVQKLVVALPENAQEGTRVVLVDNKPNGVKATWETSDNIGVWNVTAAQGGQNGYNTVHPNADAQYVQFEGTVNCQQGDQIAVFYPYGEGTGVTAHSDGTLTLDLSKQKGTLEDIAKNFDLV